MDARNCKKRRKSSWRCAGPAIGSYGMPIQSLFSGAGHCQQESNARNSQARRSSEGFGRSLSKEDEVFVEATGNAMAVVRVLSPYVAQAPSSLQVKAIAHAHVKNLSSALLPISCSSLIGAPATRVHRHVDKERGKWVFASMRLWRRCRG